MLRMGDDENVTTFMQRVNELVCGIRGASGKLEESEVVAKVLRSFPAAYKVKATAIEELQTITNVTRDMLVGKLTAFELSEFGDALPKVESKFKATTSRRDRQRYDPGESSSRKTFKYEDEIRQIEEEEREMEELEALIVKRVQ